MPKANSKKAARALPSTAVPAASTSTSSASGAPLFEIDTTGSSSVRHSLLHQASGSSAANARLRKGASFNRPLKSDQILAMRSDQPAMTSRRVPTTSTALAKREEHKRMKVDRETKEKLKRMVGRGGEGEGLWGVKGGEMVVKMAEPSAGEYDAWAVEKRKKKLSDAESLKRENELRRLAVPKLIDSTSGPRAVPLPHAGMSYNPSHPHHQALLANVLESYTAAEARDEHGQDTKDAMDAIRQSVKGRENWEMYEEEVGSGEEETDDEEDKAEGEGETGLKKKPTKRKTRQQRNKKLANAKELLAIAERKAVKARLHSVLSAPTLNKDLAASEELSLAEKAAALRVRKAKLQAQGLTRLRSGPSRVPDAQMHFQLGEELADNLRTLAPEGNLWRDWVGSSMRRGKVPVERSNANKKGGKYGGGHQKGHGTKEKEKYAYKNFQV